MLDDRELWKKIAAGDAQAFDGWYCDNAPRLRAFLRHLLGNQQAAEDVMQETFTHIWRRPQAFDPERGPLRAWLFGIARKQAAEWGRKHRPTDSIDTDGVGPDGGDAGGARFCRTEASSVMADALRRLPSDQRTLLWLREVEGQSYAELAAILDIPIGTVRSRLFAAREALRAVWHSTQPEGGPHALR